MKKTLLLLTFLCLTISVSAQFGRQRNSRQNQFNRQPQSPPTETQKEQAEKKLKEKQKEFLDGFIASLEADEFQKEIATITITEFYEKLKDFIKIKFASSVERKDAYEAFKDKHFKELKSLLSEPDTIKLDKFLEGDYKKDKDKSKKKKKPKKKKRNKNN